MYNKIERLVESITTDVCRRLKREYSYDSVANYIFSHDNKGNMYVLAGRRLGNNYAGLFNVPTGLVGDTDATESVRDAAVREIYEETGLRVNKNSLTDVGDTKYTNRWGEHLGKNFVLYLNGTIDDYKIGAGDGENERFMWIREDKINSIPWAFNMDNMVKQLIAHHNS